MAGLHTRCGLPVVIGAIFATSWLGMLALLLASWRVTLSPLARLDPLFTLAPGLVALGAA